LVVQPGSNIMNTRLHLAFQGEAWSHDFVSALRENKN